MRANGTCSSNRESEKASLCWPAGGLNASKFLYFVPHFVSKKVCTAPGTLKGNGSTKTTTKYNANNGNKLNTVAVPARAGRFATC